MSNIATIKSSTNEVTGKLVLTNYGLLRVLERIQNLDTFTPFNIAVIGIGNKISNSYDSSISALKNEVATFDVDSEYITVSGDTCTISCDLVMSSGITMRELGVYEVIRGKRYLFAYASGFSMVANENLSYDLVVDLSLRVAFKDTDYRKYDVSIGDIEYAYHPDVVNLYSALSNVQLDLERCIQANANKLGFNKAEVFFKERRKLSELLQTTLLFNRYQKLISKFERSDMTDCFFYPDTDKDNYSIRNLCNSDSYIRVDNALQNANKDYTDLSTPATIIWSGTINSLDKVGIIIGKIDPKSDRYYFDFRIMSDDVTDDSAEKYLQFTIYSYDVKTAQGVESGETSEFEVVGHLRIKCYLSESMRQRILGKDCSYTFVFNGDEDNPNIDFYIDTTKMDVIVDNFNFVKFPTQEELAAISNGSTSLLNVADADIMVKFYNSFKEACTIKNYTSFTETIPYGTPVTYSGSSIVNYEDTVYYYLDTIKTTSVVTFGRALSESDIQYIALISQS